MDVRPTKETTVRSTRILAALAAVLLLPLLAACGSSTSSDASSAASSPAVAQPQGGAELAGTSWILTDGPFTMEDVTGAEVTLNFEADQANGKSGVNNYFGGYTSSTDGTLQFDALGSTMMAGPEDLMTLEAEYLAALQSTFGYTIDGDTLTLFGAADQVLTFTAA
jgi:heat shock protein HslJ